LRSGSLAGRPAAACHTIVTLGFYRIGRDRPKQDGKIEEHTMFIRSERLFLRPGWPEDWTELLARVADEGIVRNLATAPWPYTADAARAYASLPQAPRHPHFMVTLPGAEGSRLIGTVGLIAGHNGAGPELGYWIARDQWNRGYATEAARAVLKLARTLGHRRVTAHRFLDNPASGRVLRKLGFCPTALTERASLGRGGPAPSETLALDLGEPSDCDGGSVMRAA
jgi:RimJ/RimL family protein N-acetyltransferase